MNKNKTKLSIPIVIFLSTILLFGLEVSVVNALTYKPDPVQELPFFLRSYAEHITNGNQTQLNSMLNQMVQQEQINAKLKESRSEILLPDLEPNVFITGKIQPRYVGMFWFSDVAGISEDTYEHDDPTEKLVGKIYNPDNLEMYQDNNCAEFFTAGWDLVDTDHGGGEACANGPLTDTFSNGYVYIKAKTGPLWDPSTTLTDEHGSYAWENWVIVYVSDGDVPMGQATYVGCVSVQSTTLTQYTVGYISGGFNRIHISCWTPPWAPQDYSPHSYNDVLIDNAYVFGAS